ncbi:MAG TPA: dihydrodipicolinate synthase family protein [Gemmatimonadales bacterium]
MVPFPVRRALLGGVVIPAHPLALTPSRRLDERRQRALTRYYIDAGAGGVAVGVHTTQFAIRHPKVGLYRPVLQLAAETLAEREPRLRRPMVRIAGIAGRTGQAVREAGVARDLDYHVGLLSLGALPRASDSALLEHARAVAEVVPLMGFYLQPAVGGRVLSYDFWRRFVQIENVVGIKVAPFNRYDTWEVVRAVADSGRRIALYTGNDDNIVIDLLTTYPVLRPGVRRPTRVRMVGGLLGHWAFWTSKAVALLKRVHHVLARHRTSRNIPGGMLGLATHITDANGAIFDAVNGYRGCIPGINEILRRQGLLRGRWCLDPNEDLSPGQMGEIDRVCRAYPHLADDQFVEERLDGWLR